MSNFLRNQNFRQVGNGICLSVTTASNVTAFPTIKPGGTRDMLVVNAGTVPVAITWGDANSIGAAFPTNGSPANGMVILPGAIMVIDKGYSTFLDAVTASGSSTLYAYQGEGS